MCIFVKSNIISIYDKCTFYRLAMRSLLSIKTKRDCQFNFVQQTLVYVLAYTLVHQEVRWPTTTKTPCGCTM